MLLYPHYSLLMLVFLLLINLGSSHNHCKEHRCGRHGPPIRFPFYLSDGQTDYSDHPPGFGLSCTDKHQTILELYSVKLSIKEISYPYQYIDIINDPEDCLPKQLLKMYQSSNITSEVGVDPFVTFFNCSSVGKQKLKTPLWYSSEQDLFSCPIVIVESGDDIARMDLVSCTKLLDVTGYVFGFGLGFSYDNNHLSLGWSKPNCSICESKEMVCKLRNNGTNGETECTTCPNRIRMTLRSRVVIAAGVIGPILMVPLVITLFQIYNYYKNKGEDQARVERFLEDYRSQKPTRFSYADIKRITNNFKNNLGEGAHGAVFKGMLSEKIIVAVKILNNTEGDGKEFINEVGTMGKIHHVNVVRLLGFCADGVYRAFVYDFFPNGSLQYFICPPDNKQIFLGWEKLEQIALGVAKGIEYLHLGCDQRILHFDINPHNVLFDDNFTPKISDFGLAKLCSKNRSTVSITAVKGTLGYIAPEVFSRNFGRVSYKSDIYSYGMLLLEMVGGKKNTQASEETFQVLYPEWIHNLLDEGGDIRIHIKREGDIKIAKKLAIVGLWCIQWHPANRPSIRNVLQMLERDEAKLQVPPNPFDSTTSTSTSAIIPARQMELQLEVIHELE